MRRARLTRALAALVAVGVLASCGEDVLQAAGDHERIRVKRDARVDTQDRADRGSDRRAAAARTAEQSAPDRARRQPGRAVTVAGAAAPVRGDGAAEPPQRSPGQATREARPASSCADDMSGDREGSGAAPAYTDLIRGCVSEHRRQLVLEATTAGTLPARMPDGGTNLAMGFELGGEVYVGLQSADDGWSAYLSRGRGRQALPPPQVSGRSVRLALPSSALGDARQVAWRLESSWTRSTLTSTSYAFDDAPNGHTASFDRG